MKDPRYKGHPRHLSLYILAHERHLFTLLLTNNYFILYLPVRSFSLSHIWHFACDKCPTMVATATLEEDIMPSMDDKQRKSGCFVSKTTGILLIVLAIILAVAVGILVHFTSKRGNSTQCHCMFPGSTSVQDGHSQESQIQFCNSLGENTKRCE